MREHIALLEGENSETMRQFEYLYAFYEVHKGRYAKLKAWYLEHYKDEYKDGNDEARSTFIHRKKKEVNGDMGRCIA